MSKHGFQSDLRDESPGSERQLEFLEDVELRVTLELGSAEITIGRLIQLKPGSVIELDKRSDEPFDFRVNGKLVAKGDPIVVNDHYGVRINSVIENDL